MYDLTDDEIVVLTSNYIEEQPIEKRLEILNNVIGADFSEKVTMGHLDSEQRISVALHPEVQQDLEHRQRQEQELFSGRRKQPYSTRTCRTESVRLWTGVTCSCSMMVKAGIGKRNTVGRLKSARYPYNRQKQRENIK